MPRSRDYAAEYAARQAREAARGRTVYEARIAPRLAEGLTRAEARGHGTVPVAQLRQYGIPEARLRERAGTPAPTRTPQGAQLPPVIEIGQGGGLPYRMRRELLAMTPARAYALLAEIYPDPDLTDHERFSLAFGSP